MQIVADQPKIVEVTDGGRPCPALSIALSDSDPYHQWGLTVFVERTNGGLVALGHLVTTPAGDGCAPRVVALAYCPGAIRWQVLADESTVAEGAEQVRAELSLSVDRRGCSCEALVAVPGAAVVTTPIRLLDVSPTSSALSSTQYRGFDIWIPPASGAVEVVILFTPQNTAVLGNGYEMGIQENGALTPAGFVVVPWNPFPTPTMARRLNIPIRPGVSRITVVLRDLVGGGVAAVEPEVT